MTAPLDANGKPLKEGDEILVRAKVVRLVHKSGKMRASVIFQWSEGEDREGCGSTGPANVEKRK